MGILKIVKTLGIGTSVVQRVLARAAHRRASRPTKEPPVGQSSAAYRALSREIVE
jgi:hypothetical protein